MTGAPRSRPAFATTRWSLIKSAADADEALAREALEELCAIYWYPLYAYLRRIGQDADDAADLVQGLFLRLLERDGLASVKEEGGRFRSWLLTALRHHAANIQAAGRALRRGGSKRFSSIDIDSGEVRFSREPVSAGLDPDRFLLRRWALATIAEARRRLELDAKSRGKEALLAALAGHLGSGAEVASLDQIGRDLGMATGTVKVALHRFRKRMGFLIRQTLAETLEPEDDVEIELAELMEALR